LPVVASLSSSITSAIGNHGLYAVFGLMLIDAVFPAASELVMVYAGALAAGAFAGQHVDLFGTRFSSGFSAYLAVALAGTLGYLAGSLLGWALGAYVGRGFFERHGRWLHITPDKLVRADRWFDRWGSFTVLFGRVTPVLRSFISIPAGFLGMPIGPYTVLTLIGSAIWAFVLAGIGWAIGRSWERFHSDFRFVDYAVALIVLFGIAWLAWRWYKRRQESQGSRANVL
jgi:membrane protein DedA with SNARE-associated domain